MKQYSQGHAAEARLYSWLVAKALLSFFAQTMRKFTDAKGAENALSMTDKPDSVLH